MPIQIFSRVKDGALSQVSGTPNAAHIRYTYKKKQFKYIFHEGEKNNIYISNVGDNFLMILIFDSQSALGMIRIYTKRAIDALVNLLTDAKEEEQKSSQFVDVDFNKYLNEELDKAFNF